MSNFARDHEIETQGASSLAFGPYELVRTLRAAKSAERHLALHPELLTNHVAYRFRFTNPRTQRRRFLEAVEKAAALDIAHILKVEQFSFASQQEAWVISPYTGNHDGLLLLNDLLAVKGGKMEAIEVVRVLDHLLEAVGAAHNAGVVNGPIQIDEIHVDRAGSLSIELYGVATAMQGEQDIDELRLAEFRSIASIAYKLLTGVDASEDVFIEPTRLVPKLDTAWNTFFAEALDPAAGFQTPAEMLAAIPGRRSVAAAPEIRVRSVNAFGLGRLRGKNGTASRAR